MKQHYKLLIGLAMLLTLGFTGGTIMTATPANALIIAQCPDGSAPDENFECPATCTNTACPAGQECQIQQNTPICVPTISCANVLCTAGTQCIETANGPQCVPITPPVYPTCAELACSGSTQCKTLAGRARCVPISGGNSSSPFGYTNTFSNALGNFNAISSGFTYGITSPSANGVSSFNTFQGAQNQFNSLQNQQQQACVTSGKTWTGSYCKFW